MELTFQQLTPIKPIKPFYKASIRHKYFVKGLKEKRNNIEINF